MQGEERPPLTRNQATKQYTHTATKKTLPESPPRPPRPAPPHPPKKVAIRTQHWTAINHAAVWGSLGAWLPFLLALAALSSSSPGLAPLGGLGPSLLAAPGFWLASVVAAPLAALLADFSLAAFSRQVAPTAGEVLQASLGPGSFCLVGGGA
jgi:hypothetical protein